MPWRRARARAAWSSSSAVRIAPVSTLAVILTGCLRLRFQLDFRVDAHAERLHQPGCLVVDAARIGKVEHAELTAAQCPGLDHMEGPWLNEITGIGAVFRAKDRPAGLALGQL